MQHCAWCLEQNTRLLPCRFLASQITVHLQCISSVLINILAGCVEEDQSSAGVRSTLLEHASICCVLKCRHSHLINPETDIVEMVVVMM